MRPAEARAPAGLGARRETGIGALPLALLLAPLLAAAPAALAAPTVAAAAVATDSAATHSPTPGPRAEGEPSHKSDAELSAREIYQRVLDNRFESYQQVSKLVSSDRAQRSQATVFHMWFQSFRGPDDEPLDGVVTSKAMVRYTEPYDLRHSGYLVIHKLDHPDDQFIYRSSNRLVRRVNLRGEQVFGTDFSFEDVIPREIDDARYERLPDTKEDGIDCFVVRAIPKRSAHSEYSRFEVTVDKRRSIPLHIRDWDNRRVEIKELHTAPADVERIEGVFVPMKSRMTNLREDSYTELVIAEIHPNIRISKSRFDPRRLTSSH